MALQALEKTEQTLIDTEKADRQQMLHLECSSMCLFG